jgi:hypothetical protein
MFGVISCIPRRYILGRLRLPPGKRIKRHSAADGTKHLPIYCNSLKAIQRKLVQSLLRKGLIGV